jgi:hypothetical protein
MRTAAANPGMYDQSALGGGQDLRAGIGAFFGYVPSVADMDVDNLRQDDMMFRDQHLHRRAITQIENMYRIFIEGADGWQFDLCPPEYNANERADWSITTVVPSIADLAPELSSPTNVETMYERHSAYMLRFNKGWRTTIDSFKTAEGREVVTLHIANIGSVFITTMKVRVNYALLRMNYHYIAFNGKYGPHLGTPDMKSMADEANRLFGFAAKSPQFLPQVAAYCREIFRSENLADSFNRIVVPAGTLDKLVFTNEFEMRRDLRGPKAEKRLQRGGEAMSRAYTKVAVDEDNVWRNIGLPQSEQEVLISRAMVGRSALMSMADHPTAHLHEKFDPHLQLSVQVHDMRIDAKVVLYARDALRACGRYDHNGLLNDTHQRLVDDVNSGSLPPGVAGVWTDLRGNERVDTFATKDANGQWVVADTFGKIPKEDFSLEQHALVAQLIEARLVKSGAISRETHQAFATLAAIRQRLYRPRFNAATWTAIATNAAGDAPANALPYGRVSYSEMKKLAQGWAPQDAALLQLQRDIAAGLAAFKEVISALQVVFPATISKQDDDSKGKKLASNPFLDGQYAALDGSLFGEDERTEAVLFDNLLGFVAYPLFVTGGAEGGPTNAVRDAALRAKLEALGFTGAQLDRVVALTKQPEFDLYGVSLKQRIVDNGEDDALERLVADPQNGYFDADVAADTRFDRFYTEQLNTSDTVGDARVLASVLLMALRPDGALHRDHIASARKKAPPARAAVVGGFASNTYAALGADADVFSAFRGSEAAYTRARISVDPDVLRDAARADALGSIRPADPADPARALDATADNLNAVVKHASASRHSFGNAAVSGESDDGAAAASADDFFSYRVGSAAEARRYAPRVFLGSFDAVPVAVERYAYFGERLANQPLQRIIAQLLITQPNTYDSAVALIENGAYLPFSVLWVNSFAQFDMGSALAFVSGAGSTWYSISNTSVEFNSNKGIVQSTSFMRTEAEIKRSDKVLIIRNCIFRRHVAGLTTAVFESPKEFHSVVGTPNYVAHAQKHQKASFFFVCPATLTSNDLTSSLYLGGDYDALAWQGQEPSDIATVLERRSWPSATFYALHYGLHRINEGKEANYTTLHQARLSNIVNTRCDLCPRAYYDSHTGDWTNVKQGRGPLPAIDLPQMEGVFSGRQMLHYDAPIIVSPLT